MTPAGRQHTGGAPILQAESVGANSATNPVISRHFIRFIIIFPNYYLQQADRKIRKLNNYSKTLNMTGITGHDEKV
jgi:hypothetical protein